MIASIFNQPYSHADVNVKVNQPPMSLTLMDQSRDSDSERPMHDVSRWVSEPTLTELLRVEPVIATASGASLGAFVVTFGGSR